MSSSFKTISACIATLAFAMVCCTGSVLAAEGGAPPPAAPKDPAPKAAAPDKPVEKAPPADPKAAPDARKDSEPASGKEYEMEEVTVWTATKTKTNVFRLSRFLTIVDEEEFRRLNPTVGVDTLGLRIGTWVEHRTATTGDPVIRGLSGGNLLALVDGCSLSTFWGEGGFAGDDMYGKVDPDCVERIEVLRGPGSVMYGSQALGAVVNFITRSSPYDFTEEGDRIGVRGKYTYTSGNNGLSWRAEVFGAGTFYRFLMGGSFRDLNDMRAGGDVGILNHTSGEDYNYDLKWDFKIAKGHVVSISHQNVHRVDTHRYYRQTQ